MNSEESNFAYRLENKVAINRLNEEWEAAYMTFEEIVRMEARQAKEEGRAEGRVEGRQESLNSNIKTLLKKFPPEEVAELLEISVDEVKAVI